MGMFSWCTADTRKSISFEMRGYEDPPQKVYLLNPFGMPYEETNYEGYGVIGGVDVYAMVAKWNAPEKCTDSNGDWYPDDILRLIGINLACDDSDHVQLKYPIKIVEHPCNYNSAGISPNCPYQGFFYPGDQDEIKEAVNDAFESLWEAEHACLEFLSRLRQNDPDKILDALNLYSYSDFNMAYVSIAAKNPNTPEAVLMKIAKEGNGMHKRELWRNSALPLSVLRELEKTDDKTILDKVRHHPNYAKKESELDEKIENIKGNLSKDNDLGERDTGKDHGRN